MSSFGTEPINNTTKCIFTLVFSLKKKKQNVWGFSYSSDLQGGPEHSSRWMLMQEVLATNGIP